MRLIHVKNVTPLILITSTYYLDITQTFLSFLSEKQPKLEMVEILRFKTIGFTNVDTLFEFHYKLLLFETE